MTALSTNFDKGVLTFKDEPVYYERVPGAWQARVVGAAELLPMTKELQDAITADVAHQRSKA